MKKLLAICLTFIMVFSLTVPAFAATVDVPAKTVFNQSFAGLTEAPADWTVTGSGTFVDTGILTGHNETEGPTLIRYNDSFNAGKADYTFTVEFAHYSGNQRVHFGADTAANAVSTSTDVAGYTLTATMDTSTYKSGKYSLYKNGEKLADFTDANASYGYQGIRTFSFEVTDEAVIVTGPFTGSPITVADTDPVKSGYVGMYLTNNNKGSTVPRLGAMSLTTDAYSYEVDATQAVTGATASWSEVVAGQEYLNVPDFAETQGYLNSYEVVGSDITVPADMDVRLTATANGFAYRTGNLNLRVLGYTFTFKVAAMTDTDMTVTINDGTSDIATKTVPRLAMSTASNASGYYYNAVNLVVDITSSKITLTAKGEEVISADLVNPKNTSGNVAFRMQEYNASKKFDNVVLETLDKEVVTTKTNFLLDKTFTANDTAADLTADGFVVNGTPSENGIQAGSNCSVAYTGAKLGGSYTVEVVASKPYAASYFDFNVSDAGKYRITANQSGYTNGQGTGSITLTKTGVDEALFEVTSFPNINGINNKIKYSVVLTENAETGALDIAVKIGSTTIATVTDETPFAEGTFYFENVAGTSTLIRSVKAYPTSVATPAYEGKFDIGGTTAEAASKGVTYFTFPVTMLGQSPDFIAALYEDGKMTDIKFYDVDAVNAAPVELFDTTASAASKVEIKVFVWDSLTGLVPVLAPFTLD